MLEEVRAHLRERGRTQTQWEVGSSAPPGLVEALLERGLTQDKDPYAVALVLTQRAAAAPPEGLAARRIESFEEYAAANAVQWEAFELAAGGNRRGARRSSSSVTPRRSTCVHARLARTASSSAPAPPARPSTACCSTAARRAERARGRGAYRALIRARWDDAVALGTPALITQGGSMSAPDPGAHRLRAGRRGAHAAGRLCGRVIAQANTSTRYVDIPWTEFTSIRNGPVMKGVTMPYAIRGRIPSQVTRFPFGS